MISKQESFKLFEQHLRQQKAAKKLNQVKHVIVANPVRHKRKMSYAEIVATTEDAPF